MMTKLRVRLKSGEKGKLQVASKELIEDIKPKPCIWCRFKMWLKEPIIYPSVGE